MHSRRNLCAIALSFILLGMLSPVLMPQTAFASSTIYIKSDGSILPSGVNITTTDNRTYTFTGNVNDTIIIQRDNIIVDGVGYSLMGTGEEALLLMYLTNVTIKNVRVEESQTGIYLYKCSLCNITSNVLTGNSWHAINLDTSSNNSICDNVVTGNSNRAIYVDYSSHNDILGNEVSNNYKGIELTASSQHNNISGNIISDNLHEGIILGWNCNYNDICENNVTRNTSTGIVIGPYSANNSICDNRLWNNTNTGLVLSHSANCTIIGNEATENFFGIEIMYSNNTLMRNNTMFGNEYDFGFWFISYSDFPNDVDVSNTVGGRPIYYWTEKQDMVVPSDAGIVILFNCTDMTVQNLNITDPVWDAVIVAYCTNTTIANNYIVNGEDCIYLWNCSNCNVTSNFLEGFMSIQLFNSTRNTIFNNTITGGGNMGAISLSLSRDNTFYHNNFTNNYYDVLVDEQDPNNWDNGYPDGGNYWDNYEPRMLGEKDECSGPNQNETGGDGFWDMPYPLNDNNTDRYPIVPEYSSMLTIILLVSASPLIIAVLRRKKISSKSQKL